MQHEIYSSVRKCSEDPRLRPFLSARFDVQSYIRTVLKEGRSEDCFNEITASIDEVNAEIKNYISAHKNNLMSGMQDVAVLAERYEMLSTMSETMKRNISKLKKEVNDSHETIRFKTTELERIHQASTTLRYLRQFVHSKNQLDHFLKTSIDEKNVSTKDTVRLQNAHFDVRNMATAAKIVNELESLIEMPLLKGISEVSSNVSFVRLLANELRKGTHEVLFSALKDRNQSTIGACLQIFFHLETLPEIVLLVIDKTVKETIDSISTVFDIDSFVKAMPELSSSGKIATNTTSTKSNSSNALMPFPNSTQIQNNIREFVSLYSNVIEEQTNVIFVLQKVLVKKEDPSTHQRFVDVLKRIAIVHENESSMQLSHRNLLSKGQFVELFWNRFGVLFQDKLNECLRSQPVALARLYPTLRKATVEIMKKFQTPVFSEHRDDLSFLGITSLDSFSVSKEVSFSESSIFGGLQWSQHHYSEMLSSSKGKDNIETDEQNINNNNNINNNESDNIQQQINNNTIINNNNDSGLVSCLRSVRDRYLINAFQRMTFPVLQMFPEIEGYTAAIPSKRDIQTLFRAMQIEMTLVASEGDIGLLKLLCKESVKVIQLMLSKIESMIIVSINNNNNNNTGNNNNNTNNISTNNITNINNNNTTNNTNNTTTINNNNTSINSNVNEVSRLSSSNGFVRNSSQEHNALLLNLLALLMDSVERLPEAVMKQAQTDGGPSLLWRGGGNTGNTTGNTGSTTGNTTGNSGNTGSTSGNSGSTSGNSGSTSGNSGSTSGNSGSTSGSSGSTSGNMVASMGSDMGQAMSISLESAVKSIQDLTTHQLLSPLLDTIMSFIRSHFMGLLKEGFTSSLSNNNDSSQHEASRTMASLQRLLPELLKHHLMNLIRNRCVMNAIDELCCRMLHCYISIAAAMRPLSEASKTRMAKDMSVLEEIIVDLLANNRSNGQQTANRYFSVESTCPIAQEFRSFRRLLFLEDMESQSSSSMTSLSSSSLSLPPSKKLLMSHQLLDHLRPSTILDLLISMAPALLPSPWDTAGPNEFFEGLTVVRPVPSSSSVSLSFPSVKECYSHPWKRNEYELKVWNQIQHCLDVLLQRLTVIADDRQKQNLRAWYEVLQDIGGHYFGSA